MRRRELLLLLGGMMPAASALRAQQKAMPVIGYLMGGSLGPVAPLVAAVRQGLSETGYVEGQNVAIESRWAEGHSDRLTGLAADLVGRRVDVIAAGGVAAVLLVGKVLYPALTPAQAAGVVVPHENADDFAGSNGDSAQTARPPGKAAGQPETGR